jgi:hypothetical protein
VRLSASAHPQPLELPARPSADAHDLARLQPRQLRADLLEHRLELPLLLQDGVAEDLPLVLRVG